MKTHYLIAAIVLTVVLIIIAFQNIQTQAPFVIFFSFKSVRMTLPVLFLSSVGMAAGALYAIAIRSAIDKKMEDIRQEENAEF